MRIYAASVGGYRSMSEVGCSGVESVPAALIDALPTLVDIVGPETLQRLDGSKQPADDWPRGTPETVGYALTRLGRDQKESAWWNGFSERSRVGE